MRACVCALVVAASPAVDAGAQAVLAQVPVPQNAASTVAVNVHLNKIYLSGGALAHQEVFVIDGTTFKGKRVGLGSGVSVDSATDNYWAATATGGRVIVRRGSNNAEISRIPTSEGCPVSTALDGRSRRLWVENQCGEHGDTIFVFDADNSGRIAGPIPAGGVLGTAVVSSATGRLYVAISGVSKRVNSETFQMTRNAFGLVKAADPVTGKLFAVSGQTLQLINGIQDPEVISVSVDLGYAPTGLAVDFALGHIYLSNAGQSQIEVRMISTGELLSTIQMVDGLTPGSLAVDTTRGRLYACAAKGGRTFLVAVDESGGHARQDADRDW
jgi:DNA-binding beta-propeller fold protein YncE